MGIIERVKKLLQDENYLKNLLNNDIEEQLKDCPRYGVKYDWEDNGITNKLQELVAKYDTVTRKLGYGLLLKKLSIKDQILKRFKVSEKELDRVLYVLIVGQMYNPGSRSRSIGLIATVLGKSTVTISRALRVLCDWGLITRGTEYVAGKSSKKVSVLRFKRAKRLVKEAHKTAKTIASKSTKKVFIKVKKDVFTAALYAALNIKDVKRTKDANKTFCRMLASAHRALRKYLTPRDLRTRRSEIRRALTIQFGKINKYSPSRTENLVRGIMFGLVEGK